MLKEPLRLLNEADLSPAEFLAVATVQGIVNRIVPRLWLRTGGIGRTILTELQSEGVATREIADLRGLIREFKPLLKGVVRCKLGNESVNVATTLSGVLDAVALDDSLVGIAEDMGLPILADARTITTVQCLQQYASRCTKGIAVEQGIEKTGHLRDFAVQQRAFTFSTADSAFRQQIVRQFGAQSLVFGWGNDEFQWISDLSRANATGIPADWCTNLSALSRLPVQLPPFNPRKPVIAEIGTRYIAFVLSDGDNIQWLTGNFAHDEKFWASPLRGQFPMTWEVSPLLSAFAPRVLRYLYKTAKSNDAFVTGAGLPGYTFLHRQTDRVAIAKQAAPYLKRSGLRVISTLNEGIRNLVETEPLLDLPEVDGILYKDYSPYNGSKGAFLMKNGKPCLSYRFLLWEGLQSPDQVATEVATMPFYKPSEDRCFAIVNVHAWSYGKAGGPLTAIQQTIAKLPKNTKVVNAPDIIAMMTKPRGQMI